MVTEPRQKPGEPARTDGVRVSSPRCVRCGKPVAPRFRPFCSQRCSDIDLGAWLGGTYRVLTDERPEDPGTAPPVDKS
jgi:endogenous inhibitor of DNA gyrase (YacG/DUF329 family)